MTSKLVVNTIEADTGISSVSFASSISMSSTSKFHFSNAGIDIGADTNINRPAAGVLAFNINSSEKVRITSGGSVGIGTIPASGTTLDMDASGGGVLVLRRNSVSTSNKISLSHDGTNGTLDSTNAILFRAGGSERFRIDSSGSLLIGGTSSSGATEKLRIENDSATSDVCQVTIISGNAERAILNFGDAQDHNIGRVTYDNSTNALFFHTDNTERLRITSDGVVNIGDVTNNTWD